MDRLIIELLHSHGHGVEKRFVFEGGRATIGRSYSNDIILDDPFVSPEHLSVSRNGAGVHVVDLASENGTQINGEATFQDQRAKVASGDEICIGKTRLKLVLPDHPVEPARRMDTLLGLRQLLDKRSVAITFTLLTMGVMVWVSYLEGPTEKFWKKDCFEIVFGYLMLAAFYAGLFGWICYLKLRKAYFKRHLAVCNLFSLIGLFYEMLDPFLFFWVSHFGTMVFVKYSIQFFFLLAMFWSSLKLANTPMKWTAVAELSAVSLVFVLLIGWGAKDIRLEFSGDPAYPSHLAPYLGPFGDPKSIEDFFEESGPKLYKSTIKTAK